MVIVSTTKTSKTVLIHKNESTNDQKLTIKKLQIHQPTQQQQNSNIDSNSNSNGSSNSSNSNNIKDTKRQQQYNHQQQQQRKEKSLYSFITFIIYHSIFYIGVGVRNLYEYYSIFTLKIKALIFQILLSFQVKTPEDYVNYIKYRLNSDSLVVPKHLAIILNHHDQVQSTQSQLDNKIFYNKLTEILVWSIIVGVHRVTIFDNHGELKKNISYLQQLLLKRIGPFNNNKKSSSSSSSNGTTSTGKYIFNWLNHDSTNHSNNSNHDNSKLNSLLDISVVAIEDGKQELINITKKFVKEQLDQQVLNNNNGDNSNNKIGVINEAYINQNLSRPIGGSLFEPEAALDFTGQYFFAGFLPWHIKLTEFM
ncbi:hypothetical protein CYY_009923 [Polysphondylium violaceum]|uniref:ditrans,polycis-polyprenyl diphosphate synthase [(2E,6E)-farnesyldiphosphate specific] n=1 Tax=Polysphondylium violaceum TaxID=133409 RepID=A0A8J4PKM5_9MYCE|nr:hypothetical protein CYY_009923 [Polysphondylium violaceum]